MTLALKEIRMAGVSVGGYVGSLRELYFRDRRHDSGHQRVEDNTEGVKSDRSQLDIVAINHINTTRLPETDKKRSIDIHEKQASGNTKKIRTYTSR